MLEKRLYYTYSNERKKLNMNRVQKELHKKIFEANHIVMFDDAYELLCYNDIEGWYELKLKSDYHYEKITVRELDLFYHQDKIQLYKMVEL